MPCEARARPRSIGRSTKPKPRPIPEPRNSWSTCTRRTASRTAPAPRPQRRVTLAAAVLLLAACTATPPSAGSPPPPTREPGTYAVTALLDLSGSRGPRGDAQRSAMQQWASGGDAQRGTPHLKLRIVDVAGSDARLLLELKRAA